MIAGWLILIPFLVQMIVIVLDEGHFHIKRGLPRWERIGHPLDTFSVVACMAYVLAVPFSAFALKLYLVLAALSCILITKDEFIHKHHCPTAEHWVHAILFINHPILLTIVGMIWAACSPEVEASWLKEWLSHTALLRLFIWGQLIFASLFCLYQIVYWNFIYKPKNEQAS